MVLDAIRGELTMAELSRVTAYMRRGIATWKKQAIKGMAASFSGRAEALDALSEAQATKLHANIGHLVVERDFLRGGSLP